MTATQNFSAVIFDLDGTLLYSLNEIAAAGNAALARTGYPTHSIEAYCHFVGAGAHKLAMRILPDDRRTRENCDAIYPVLLEEFDQALNTIAYPYEGALEVLDILYSAGKKLAVLSNKPEEFTKVAVDKFLPEVDFFAVQGGRKDVPLKPSPVRALKICEAMGALPEETVFVGDSDVDIQTAINAGMIPVGAAWGFRGKDELIEAGAEIIFDSPIDLAKLL